MKEILLDTEFTKPADTGTLVRLIGYAFRPHGLIIQYSIGKMVDTTYTVVETRRKRIT